MENLRWILIFAGVAILVLLYFSGRGRRTPDQSEVLNRTRGNDSGGDGFGAPQDPLLGSKTDGRANDQTGADSDAMHMPQINEFGDVDPDDFSRPGGAPEARGSEARAGALGNISQKIESFGERLSSRRRERSADADEALTVDGAQASKAPESGAYDSKILTLHIVAPDGGMFDGAQLLGLFEQHGYHFGDMNIFHSMHNGKTVFSIAKLVEPGFFDIDRIESFNTPGVSLILQLPGPVAADVAFEVLVSEAFDLANALGGTVRDGDHSTLSKQSVQHMREGIYEYMHRQKYFSGVPS